MGSDCIYDTHGDENMEHKQRISESTNLYLYFHEFERMDVLVGWFDPIPV